MGRDPCGPRGQMALQPRLLCSGPATGHVPALSPPSAERVQCGSPPGAASSAVASGTFLQGLSSSLPRPICSPLRPSLPPSLPSQALQEHRHVYGLQGCSGQTQQQGPSGCSFPRETGSSAEGIGCCSSTSRERSVSGPGADFPKRSTFLRWPHGQRDTCFLVPCSLNVNLQL